MLVDTDNLTPYCKSLLLSLSVKNKVKEAMKGDCIPELVKVF